MKKSLGFLKTFLKLIFIAFPGFKKKGPLGRGLLQTPKSGILKKNEEIKSFLLILNNFKILYQFNGIEDPHKISSFIGFNVSCSYCGSHFRWFVSYFNLSFFTRGSRFCFIYLEVFGVHLKWIKARGSSFRFLNFLFLSSKRRETFLPCN